MHLQCARALPYYFRTLVPEFPKIYTVDLWFLHDERADSMALCGTEQTRETAATSLGVSGGPLIEWSVGLLALRLA